MLKTKNQQISDFFSKLQCEYCDTTDVTPEKGKLKIVRYFKKVYIPIKNYDINYDKEFEVKFLIETTIRNIKYKIPIVGDVINDVFVNLFRSDSNENVTDTYVNSIELGFVYKNFYRHKNTIAYFHYPNNLPFANEQYSLTIYLNNPLPDGEYTLRVDIEYGYLEGTDIQELWKEGNVWDIGDLITVDKDNISANFP